MHGAKPKPECRAENSAIVSNPNRKKYTNKKVYEDFVKIYKEMKKEKEENQSVKDKKDS